MNDTDNTQDRGLTTEQIAAAGARKSPRPVTRLRCGYADEDSEPTTASMTATPTTPAASPRVLQASGPADRSAPDAAGDGSAAAGPGPRASLLEDGELQSITMRWKDIQAEFVDEPEQAVQEADALVAELMQRLAAMFADERAGLEKRLAGDQQVSTEDLRQGLRRYRSFFERLLAA